jgi:iron complex outermembrane receptor protein
VLEEEGLSRGKADGLMRAIIRAAGVASCAAALHLAVPVEAGAQPNCAPASRAFAADAERTPSLGILGRKVSLHDGDVSLRDALDKIAATAGIRLSYAADLLPLSRKVCLDYSATSLSRILADVLDGSAVKPVVVASDQIVLTPARAAAAPATEAAPIMKQLGQLDRVVVTGNTSAMLDRSNPAAMDIVTSEQASNRGSASISGTLDGIVPGFWLWEQSPISLLARYGSIRGASSFGVSYPKVYVDGIEVANSLLVTHFDPDAVSRIEVIRGPQGAALYGADAISGVMNIVTRQEGSDGGPRALLRARGGATASDYSASSVLTQSHAATLRYGSASKSARLGVTGARMGAFIPDAFSQQLTANGSMRRIGSRSVLTSTLRIFAQDSRAPSSPLESLPFLVGIDSSGTQSVRQFTFGGAATFTQSDRWTHSAIAGVDGYSLQSAAMIDPAFPSAIDSALRAAAGSAVRATFKGSSVGRFGDEKGMSAVVTFGAEHSMVRDQTSMRGAPGSANPLYVDEVRSNTGIIGQVNAGFDDMLFLNGGVRFERNTSPNGLGDIAALPTLGIAAVREFGPATIKLRSAYGKAIRPIQPSTWISTLAGFPASLFGKTLSPEEQAGMEFGADASIGRVVVRATRFDQRASGLVQPVGVRIAASLDGAPKRTFFVYELQNVGEITNRGWELQGSVIEGPLSLGATFSQVDSRVRRLSSQYTGDLRTGDRMLEVPSRTFGVNAAYAKGRWFAASSISRASDWINYDRLALIDAANDPATGNPPVGPELRSFWKTYDGVTRIGGRFGVGITSGMTLTLDGENLLGVQRGEPDNATVLPGRTLSVGLSVSF